MSIRNHGLDLGIIILESEIQGIRKAIEHKMSINKFLTEKEKMLEFVKEIYNKEEGEKQ